MPVQTGVVAMVLTLLCNMAPGAYAVTDSSTAGLSGAGAASVVQRLAHAVNLEVAPTGDHVFSLDIGQPYDRGSLQSSVAEVNAQGVGVFLQRQLQAAYVLGPGAPSQDVRDVGATAATTDGGLQITVHPGDVTIDASWWVDATATAIGGLVYLALRSVCIATLTLSVAGLPASVVCASVGALVGSLTRSIIVMAADKTYADPQAWGKTLLNAVIATVGAGAWDAGVKAWATNALPGLLTRFGEGVKVIGDNVGRWFRTLGEFIRGSGETLGEIASSLPNLARNLRATSLPPAPAGTRLRVMPVGDSITEGVNSTTANGYREALERLEVAQQHPVDYVGSHQTGSMLHSRNEGWSAQEIGYIQDKTMAHLQLYSPNVVTLLAGTNDIGHGHEAGAAQRLMSFVAQILATVPDAVVLVGGLLPDASAETAAAHRRFNDQVQLNFPPRELAHLRFVTFDDLDPRGEMDGLHPNDSGYARMASRWSATIDDLLHHGLVPPRAALDDGTTSVDRVCSADGGRWLPMGPIASGVGAPGSSVQFADINGDGKADYLVVDPVTGAVHAWLNMGGTYGNWGWNDMGVVASGLAPGANVRFADINGDGKADYLVVDPVTGAVHAWLNMGGTYGNWGWNDMGVIAVGVGADPRNTTVSFADVNGDGRADYLVTNIGTGAVSAWLSMGGGYGNWGWNQMGQIASGVAANPLTTHVMFANVDCDRRAEYLVVDDQSGSINAWTDGGGTAGNWNWNPRGQIAGGVGGPFGSPPQNRLVLADLTGDGRADYLIVAPNGAVNLWINNGGD